MADIFISYAREDREYARTLAEICLGRGWTVWWDRKIPVGKSFSEVIESELQAARSVIVVWSSKSVTSEWVQNEAAEAAARRILIPVLVEDVRIPLEFRRIQAARLVGWKPGDNQPDLEDLFSSLAALLGLPSQAAGPVAGPAAAVQSRTPIEPAVVVPEVPAAPLGAAAMTDVSLLSEEPPIEPPAVVAIPVSEESVQDDGTSVEAAIDFEPGSAREPLSRRARMAVVAAVAVGGILLAFTVLRPHEYRSVIRPEDTGPVPQNAQTTLDLRRVQFQVGIVDGVGERLHLVNSADNLTERDVASVSLTQPDETSVSIRFSPAGAAKMKTLTSANVGKQMGFVRNGEVVFHAVIDGTFSSDGLISFSSTSEAKEFFLKLQGQASTAPRANVPVAGSAPLPASSGAVPRTPAPATLDEANVQTLRNVVDRDQRNAVARTQLGNLYFDAERYVDAITWYAEAIALNPKDVNVSTDLGVSYYYNNQMDLALKQLEHSLNIDPKHAKTLLNIGIVRAFGKQDLKGATEVWRRLVEIAPDSSEGRMARKALESLSSARGTVP